MNFFESNQIANPGCSKQIFAWSNQIPGAVKTRLKSDRDLNLPINGRTQGRRHRSPTKSGRVRVVEFGLTSDASCKTRIATPAAMCIGTPHSYTRQAWLANPNPKPTKLATWLPRLDTLVGLRLGLVHIMAVYAAVYKHF